MRKIRVSSTLTVYHDGQFWVGTFECVESEKLSACRIVFGAEPSAEEIQELVCEHWNDLRFTEAISVDEPARVASNPKRRQREASRELKQTGPSTKAQQALSREREAVALARKSESREKRDKAKQERFEQRREKRKQKHKGR